MRIKKYFHADQKIFSCGSKNIFMRIKKYFHADQKILLYGSKNIFMRIKKDFYTDQKRFPDEGNFRLRPGEVLPGRGGGRLNGKEQGKDPRRFPLPRTVRLRQMTFPWPGPYDFSVICDKLL
jgi:hypothetical protein